MPFIGRQPQIGNYIKLDAITTSATTTFNLTAGGVAVYPQTATNCIVSLNGIIQAPTDAYTISGSTIIFASALTTSDVIDFITVLGDVLNIGTPSDGTVSTAKLASGFTLPVVNGGTGLTSGAPAFAAYASATTSVSNATFTKVNFATEEFDTNNNFASSRFTPTVAGYYQISSSISFATSSATLQGIYKNGSGYVYSPGTGISGVVDSTSINSRIIYFNGSTDYVEVYGYQNTGGTINVQSSSTNTWFTGALVRIA